ncbi:MAG: DMT family transporter, partial [Anaerolineae bacterium]|nr:DMT family transporter [Anaerolineae bacterium]
FMGIQLQTFWMVLGAGLLGIGIISGIAFALPKVGIAAGLSAIIAGQMAMAVFVDTFALAGGDPIPLNFSRLGGLLFLALGTWAILPKE